jgi:hypothetical protein
VIYQRLDQDVRPGRHLRLNLLFFGFGGGGHG